MHSSPHVLQQALPRGAVLERPQLLTYERRRLGNALALGAADAAALSLSFLIAVYVSWWRTGELATPYWGGLVLPAWFCGAALLHLLPSWGLGAVEELRRLTILLGIVYLGTGIAIAAVSAWDLLPESLIPLAISFVVSTIAIPGARVRAKRLLLEKNVWGIPTVIYGRGESVAQIADILQRERGLGYNPVGIYDDGRVPGSRCRGVPVCGDTWDTHDSAPVAILAMPIIGRERFIELLEGPLTRYRTILVIPDMPGAPSLWVRTRDLNGLLGLEIRSNLCSPLAQFTKRTFDFGAVVVTLPFWLPLCALIALLIWLEDKSHPLFYQERVGKNGRMFRTRKFRTMHPDADRILERAIAHDASIRTEWMTSYKLKNDIRITRIGRFLRRYSLDELPQLINVLTGDMSLVGPRPLPRYHHYVLQARVQRIRERVRPGITGLWQVSGRSDTGNIGLETFDPYYVRNWSLWLDAVVLFRTVRAVRKSAGAY